LRRRVDADTAHLRQVDHEATVVDRVAGDVVATRSHGEEQVLVAGEVDRVDDIRRPSALHDQRRSTVDESIPDRTSVVIGFIFGAQDDSPNPAHERLHHL
jgi:hypothetical protein